MLLSGADILIGLTELPSFVVDSVNMGLTHRLATANAATIKNTPATATGKMTSKRTGRVGKELLDGIRLWLISATSSHATTSGGRNSKNIVCIRIAKVPSGAVADV